MPFPATIADIDAMAAIHADAFPPDDSWPRDVFAQQLGFPGVFGMLHPSGGMILMRVAADEAEILTIAVAHAARRGGVARALLCEATIHAANVGAKAIFLEVSVANIAALRLYTHAGFIQVGRRPRYYSDNTDALVLRFDVVASKQTPGAANSIGFSYQ